MQMMMVMMMMMVLVIMIMMRGVIMMCNSRMVKLLANILRSAMPFLARGFIVVSVLPVRGAARHEAVPPFSVTSTLLLMTAVMRITVVHVTMEEPVMRSMIVNGTAVAAADLAIRHRWTELLDHGPSY